MTVQELFTAEERMENSAGEQFHLGLMCWGAARSFDIGVFDAQSNEVSDEIENLQCLGAEGTYILGA